MKILRLQVHHVKLPLINPWVTSYGVEDAIESIFIKAHAKDSEAWVETCPLQAPLYSPESAMTVFCMIVNQFGPAIIGKELNNRGAIFQRLNTFRGNSFAKAGMEQCWWALESIEKNIPLHRLLGGEERKIEVGEGFGIQASIDTLVEKIGRTLQNGSARIKIKIRKGWDVSVVRAIREAFPSLRLMVDCNGSYSLEDISVFKQLDRYHLDMIEQPLYYRDLYDHATLQKELITPLCLDESITCSRDAKQAIRFGSCRVMNIKIGRVGGIFEALVIYDICRENGIPCWVGGMMESGLGAACNVELATLANFTHPSEIGVSGRFHSVDIVDPPLTMGTSAGFITPSTKPYLGRRVNEKIIDEITVQKAELI